MSRTEKAVLLVIAVLLLLGLLFWRVTSGRKEEPSSLPHGLPPLVAVSTTTLAASSTQRVIPAAPGPAIKERTSPKLASGRMTLPAMTPTGAPVAPKIELHKELIPKNIEIVRCYYSQDVVPPAITFSFDINGSGFTREFEKMIKVESGQKNIRVKTLHLVTANQIHGDMELGDDAQTGFVYPRVLIQGLPVFSAPEPFAVVRKGEVLTVFFTNMEENGRGGRFRVITNLDEALEKTFRIEASTPGIQVSDLKAQPPFVMDGHLQIAGGVPPGDHGLAVFIDGKERYRRIGMIRIVRPNIGQSGFIQGLIAEEKFHRPGDTIQIYVQATGLSPQDSTNLTAKVDEFDVGTASFTYLSPLQLRLTFQSPGNTPVGSYSVRIMSSSGQSLYEKKDLFKVIPPNWVAGIQVAPPAKSGSKSTLKILGRDFSDDYASSFRIEADEPGMAITGLRRTDASSLTAELAVNSGVAPGDYWLHLSAGGKKVDPPYGSIIKVEADQYDGTKK